MKLHIRSRLCILSHHKLAWCQTCSKKNRRSKIIRIRRDNPQARSVDMARQIGISREGVRYWLIKLQMPTRVSKKFFCLDCGKPITYGCRRCRECWKRSCHVILICDTCSKLYSIPKTDLDRKQKRGDKHNFCSNKCKGFYWRGRVYQKKKKKRK